ncbi:MFS transporter, partial [Klebsiella pneumoniae]|nr:MFS transporter [Klebsiella pneumoniae]
MSTEHMLPLAVQNKNIFRLAAAQALAGANSVVFYATCLLYTSDAADEARSVDL